MPVRLGVVSRSGAGCGRVSVLLSKLYPSGKVIYNEKAYTNEEKGLRTMSDRLTSDLSMFSKPHWQILAELEEQNAELERLRTVLMLAYLALTEGMADVPSGERYRKCASMRFEAKRAIRQVLPGMEAMQNAD